jgi:hypothetical protein
MKIGQAMCNVPIQTNYAFRYSVALHFAHFEQTAAAAGQRRKHQTVEGEGTEPRENVSVEDDHRVGTINITVNRTSIRLKRKNGEVPGAVKRLPPHSF